jgi:hypothetical protein
MLESWLLLIVSLSGHKPAHRMRLWRSLKAAGAASLRDGVYLLPQSATGEQIFNEQAEEVRRLGGTAFCLALPVSDQALSQEFRRLFDRTAEYTQLSEETAKLQDELAVLDEPRARRRLGQLQRELESITALDFFPGDARDQTKQLLGLLSNALEAQFSSNEPSAAMAEIECLQKQEYVGRTWATRKRMWVDRVASAWLIREFVDPQAHFIWLDNPRDCPAKALGFDFDGAAFTHVGNRVTFEVLMASFDLENDAALMRLATLIHFLDVGGIPVPEADGFIAILAGTKARSKDDDELLEEMGAVLKSLYVAYTDNHRNGK